MWATVMKHQLNWAVFMNSVILCLTTPVSDTNPGCPTASCVSDQGGILNTEQANDLNRLITDIYQTTACPCLPEPCRLDNSGYIIGVAIIDQMDIDSQITSDNSAIKLDVALKSAKVYASELLSRWHLGQCDNGVLIFYSKNDGVYYTTVGTTASRLLTTDIVGEISSNARMAFSLNIAQGLTKLLQDYRSVFLGKYNRTANWQSSGNEPRFAGVISAASINFFNTFSFMTLLVVFISYALKS